MGKKSHKEMRQPAPQPPPSGAVRIPWLSRVEKLVSLGSSALGISGKVSPMLSIVLMVVAVGAVIHWASRDARERTGKWLDCRAVCTWVLAIVSGVVAVVWITHRTDVKDPQFAVNLLQVGTVELPGREGMPVPCALAIAKIANSGEPSEVSGFKFTVQVRGRGPKLIGTPQLMPREVPLPIPDGTTLVFYGESSLADKVMLHPIATNDQAPGLLLYSFPGVSVDELASIGTVYELTVSDMRNRTYVGTMTAGSVATSKWQVSYFPGIRCQVRPPPRASHIH